MSVSIEKKVLFPFGEMTSFMDLYAYLVFWADGYIGDTGRLAELFSVQSMMVAPSSQSLNWG